MAEKGFDKLYGKISEGMIFPVQQADRLDILDEARLEQPPPYLLSLSTLEIDPWTQGDYSMQPLAAVKAHQSSLQATQSTL
jgi:hypothetical protein